MPPIFLIDTFDGQPPKADGSNLPTITVIGNGSFFYGYFFIAGNVNFGGAGNSPTYDTPERPDGTISETPIPNARMAGLLSKIIPKTLLYSGRLIYTLCKLTWH